MCISSAERTNPHETCIKLLADSSLEKKLLEKELARLQLENDELRHAKATLRADQLTDDEKINFYTGLPTRASFLWLVEYVKDCMPKSAILHSPDIVLLVLMKLRLHVWCSDSRDRHY